MTSPFFRRFVPAVLLLLALTIGPLLSSVTSQVSVSVHMPFGNVSGATSSSTNNRLVTRSGSVANKPGARYSMLVDWPNSIITGGCSDQIQPVQMATL
jgi:hypothetical protein